MTATSYVPSNIYNSYDLLTAPTPQPLDQELYCSAACRKADNCEPLVASPTTPTQSSTMPAWAHASPENRIERWRSSVVPGAPGQDSDDERTPSPRPRRPTPASTSALQIVRRPKLLTQASTPVASTSLSYSSGSRPLPSPVLSAPITIVNSVPRTPHRTPPVSSRPHVRPSPASSSTALTSDDSLRTPVTPVYAHRPEPAPTDTHRLSLWRHVKTWVGPASAKSPHASSPAYAPYSSRASPLLVSDEDLLSTVEIEQCRNSFSVAPLQTEDDEPQDDGLAGWFASQMKPHQLQVQPPAQPQRSSKASAAYAKRGRKLERAEARYLAIAR